MSILCTHSRFPHFPTFQQDGNVLSYNNLRIRNDFQLLLLQRAWQVPWTPETHASFQPGFRAAVETVAKSAHRMGYPHGIMLNICSFLHRDWWEDSRKQCWNYACLCEKSSKAITQKMSPGYDGSLTNTSQMEVTTKLEYCAKCHVAMYCSKSCRHRDLYLGHKAKCCFPPLISTPPCAREINLYKATLPAIPPFLEPWTSELNASTVKRTLDVTKIQTEKDDDDDDNNMDVDENDNDDASWETVESDEEDIEESTITITERISKYMRIDAA
jgi:hypothetical protein